jgi:diheme cytochrome c
MRKTNAACLLVLAAAAAASLSALGADDRYWRDNPSQKTGFLEVNDPVYAKQCGQCHFAYLPGLLPQRSWQRILSKPADHFGTSLPLTPAALEQVSKYLGENAADVSPYEGSKALLQLISPDKTPVRVSELIVIRRKHVAILEVINMRRPLKVQDLTNCDACHTKAAQGDFAVKRLSIPGLYGPNSTASAVATE